LRSNFLGCCGDLFEDLRLFDNPVVNKGFFHKRGKVIHREKEVFYQLNLLEWSLSPDNRQPMTTTTFN
jgi:hypothetical protein